MTNEFGNNLNGMPWKITEHLTHESQCTGWDSNRAHLSTSTAQVTCITARPSCLVSKHDSSILKANRKISPRAAAQVDICWIPAAEAGVRSQGSPCGITRGQSGNGAGFSPKGYGLSHSYDLNKNRSTRSQQQRLVYITKEMKLPQTLHTLRTARTGPTLMLLWAAANRWRSQLSLML